MRAQLGFLSEAEVHERFFSLSLISLLIELLRERSWDVTAQYAASDSTVD